jgi:OTU domain-containing protein 3
MVIEEDDNHARPMEDILVNSGMPSGNKVYDQALVKLVMVGTGCTDAVRVCQVLQEVYGDADAAIEFLIAEQNASVCSMQDAVQSCSELTSNGGDKEELKDNLPKTNASPQRKAVDQLASSSEGEKDGHEQRKGAHNEFAPSHQKVSRNNPCPCGSKKKYKACCEATRQKFSAKIMISREILTNKTRKQKLRNDKSELQSSSLQPQSREGPPDLGGLYI